MSNRWQLPGVLGFVHVFWQLVLFGIPLIFLVLLSFKTYELGVPVGPVTFGNYQRLFAEPLLYKALSNTILLGFMVSTISTALALFAVIVSWSIKRPVIRNLILFACIIVFFIGLIPRSFILQYLISDQGPFGTYFPFRLYSFSGIVLGYLPVFIPLSFIVLFIARKDVLQDYLHVAKELGAGNFVIQVDIVIPLIKTSIFISLVLTFLLTIADVIVINLIGGSKIYSMSALIVDYIRIDDWGMAAAASFLFLFFVLTFLFFTGKIFLKSEPS